MEQIVLYLAILAALAGFGMGLANLAGPFLRKNNISLPAINLGALLHRETGDEDDIDSLIRDAEDSDSYFSSRRSLLSGRGESSEEGEDEELDEELAGVLDQVAEEEVVAEDGEDALEEEESEDDPAIYTVSAEASDAEEQEEEEQEESAGAELDLDAVLEDDTESLALDEDAEAGEEEEAETGRRALEAARMWLVGP